VTGQPEPREGQAGPFGVADGCATSEGWLVQWEDRPTGVTVRNPVVRIAGWRETKTLKPIDKVSLGEIYESPGRNDSERDCGLENTRSEGRAHAHRAKAA
jgi:hypothetical protein